MKTVLPIGTCMRKIISMWRTLFAKTLSRQDTIPTTLKCHLLQQTSACVSNQGYMFDTTTNKQQASKQTHKPTTTITAPWRHLVQKHAPVSHKQTPTTAAPCIHTWVAVIVEEQPCRRILRLRWWRHTIVTTVAEKLLGEDIEERGYHLELPPETGRCRHRRRRRRRHGRYRRRRDAAGVILRVGHVTATSGRRCWRDAQTSHFLIPFAAFAIIFLFFVSVLFVPLYLNIRVSTLNLYSIRCCFMVLCYCFIV